MKTPLKPVADALAEICAAIPPLEDEFIPLSQSLGRISAENIIAGTHHPLATMSAMDGYGVRAQDTTTQTPLRLVGESAAGRPYPHPLLAGEAIRIYTGAYAPEGCDAIILQEEVEAVDDTITPPEPQPSGRFIRPRGQDFARDDVLVEKGQIITARRMALCALGLQNRVLTKKKPHIAILSTGDELIAAGGIPRFGQLINSNAVFLASALRQAGADVTDLGVVSDEAGALDMVSETAQNYDVIITTGGASVGKYDIITRDLKANQNMSLDFWKIAMRPGKPLILGKVGDTPLIGLPGNPVSVAVCCFVFLRPLIGHLMARDDLNLALKTAYCTTALKPNDQRADYMRARAECDSDGKWHITPFQQQDSAQMLNLSKANSLLIRQPHDGALAAGDEVTMALLPDGF